MFDTMSATDRRTSALVCAFVCGLSSAAMGIAPFILMHP
jgi:hypothetical protein